MFGKVFRYSWLNDYDDLNYIVKFRKLDDNFEYMFYFLIQKVTIVYLILKNDRNILKWKFF